MKNELGSRMKENYENAYRIKLTRRTPVIIRVDGKAFHTLTRKCEKPFDEFFHNCMFNAMESLCKEIQGAKCAYMQSDEISILISDFDTIRTGAWFDYNLQKLVSVSASIASLAFWNIWQHEHGGGPMSVFDARAFNIPKDEVKNYFIWRQIDWIRNSVSMLAQAHYSHRDLLNKNQADMHEMLHWKEVNWADLDDAWKNGTFLFKWESGWERLDNLILTRDERPVIGHVFDYLVWDKDKFSGEPIDVFAIERKEQ